MNINLFNRKYWLRSFEQQREVKGYLTSKYKDTVVSIHVHPLGSDALQALPEGARTVKRLEGHGVAPLVASDVNANRKGDLLLYDGEWYECTKSQKYDRTLLSHYNYEFVEIPKDGSRNNDIKNAPKRNPSSMEAGGRCGCF